MTTLRRFSVLPRPVAPSDARLLLERMRDRAGHAATFLTQRAKPQTDRRRKPGL
jgi:hypothetical protein